MFIRSLRKTSVALVLFGALACGGGDDGNGPGSDELLGTWDLTEATISSVADPQTGVDLVASGMGMTLEFTEANMTITISFPGIPAQSFTTPNNSTATGMSLDFDGDGSSDQGTFEVNGNTLTISSSSTYDFDADGTDEDAVFQMSFDKQ